MNKGQKIVPPKHKFIEVINKYILPDLSRKKPDDFYRGSISEMKAKGA